MRNIKIVGLSLLVASCSGIQPKKPSSQNYVTKSEIREIIQDAMRPQSIAVASQNTAPKVSKEVEENEPEEQAFDVDNTASGTTHFDPKNELNLEYSPKLFNFWVNYFTKREKKRFARHMRNGQLYREIVRETFKKHGLPEDLFFVGLIESGFNTHIRSHASAVGPWQFIRGTALRYGLRVERSVDERSNIHKASEAAAGYFKDLYNIFGSWELALCAYNAGEYRIINAIRKGNTRDYRELVRKKLIPKETIYYVPKVAAAREIYNNLSKYKFTNITNDGRIFTESEIQTISGSFDLKSLASHLGLSYSHMRKLNPDFKYRQVRSRRGKVRVVVPKNKVQRVASFTPKKGRFYTDLPEYHYVKRGESLYTIAKRYGTSIKTLKRSNGLKKSFIYTGQKLILPGSDSASTKKVAKTKVHRVRSGESLTVLAKKYGTSVSKIKRINKLKRNTLYKGEKLRVPASTVSHKTYVVRRGDNLFKIARKFRTSIQKIASINSLKNNRIYSGQRLFIPRG